MKHSFIVTIDAPEELSRGYIKEYIKTAIKQWRKGGDPDSVLFNMKDRKFSVVSYVYRRL